MSHKIYTTEAIVCGSRANNTSDKSFMLFTQDAGMLWAAARSVREERSRQRYALQDFSLIRASLVQGKSGWKIGSVEGVRNYFRETNSSAREARGAVTAVVRLLRQYVHGEGFPASLFADVKKVLEKVSLVTSNEEGRRLLDIFTLRLLHCLGYIAKSEELNPYLINAKWWELPPLTTGLQNQIERAKQVSHL